MAERSIEAAQPQGRGAISKILVRLIGLVSFGLLGFLIIGMIVRFTTPVPVQRLALVEDVPLPGIVVAPPGQPPILTVRSDRFDFQALDPQTGLLFIAHPGPTAAKATVLLQEQLPAGTQIKPTIVVFNTRTNQYVGSLDVPFVQGIAVAPDLHKVYAADHNDSKIFVIDERTLKVITQIKATQNPDSLEYVQDLQQVYVSEPGLATPGKGVEDVIDAQSDQVVQAINLGADTGLGHTRYDSVSHQVFVVIDTTPQNQIIVIDPLTATVRTRIALPNTCAGAHGLVIDSQQQLAFVACVDTQNVVVVDIRTLKVIGDPQHLQQVGVKADILALDHVLHVLYVASASSISVFDESPAARGTLHKIGDYVVSSSTSHTIAVDDTTHNIYVPLIDVGGRPTLRIEHYNQNGA
ncbi:MAG: YncE family protein [Chloroflexi bacterium]|nr:YncE family protein [Chloroflexota bacterium]